MPKYRVYGIATASWVLGEYEAATPEDAERQADQDPDADAFKTICHQCSDEVEIGDMWKTEVEEI